MRNFVKATVKIDGYIGWAARPTEEEAIEKAAVRARYSRWCAERYA